MGEYEIECKDCGWQGARLSLDKQEDATAGKTLSFCPDCGGTDFENVAEKDKVQSSQSGL
jgi:hypothetical protein